MKVNLKDYDNSWYTPGAGSIKRALWYVTNALLFDSWLCPFSGVKCGLLRIFGAKVGIGVVLKPRINIKYPWHLEIDDHVWLGEGVWIDNLAMVRLRSNVCLSQGARLFTGNHDYKDQKFGLIVGNIEIDQGAWVGASAVICSGVHVARSVVITVNSVLSGPTEVGGVYQGNPARRIRERCSSKTADS